MQNHLSDNKTCQRILLSSFLASALFWVCLPAVAAENLKLTHTNTLLTSLIRLADDQNLYEHFGIQLELDAKDTDEAVIRSLLGNQTDVAVLADASFVKYALKHPNLRLIANIGQSDNEIKIVARKDHGITTPDDLRGKRIGTQPGVVFHLFLGRLLMKHGMTRQDVTPLFMPASRLPGALANGLIDAMATREPYLSQALALEAENLQLISAPGIYTKSFNLVTTHEFLQSSRAKSLHPLLQALHEAEKRLESQPDAMTVLLSKQLDITLEEVKNQLHEVRLRLNIDNHLLASLEAIAQWLQPAQGETDDESINFLPYLHTPLLATVKPDSVSLLPNTPLVSH